MALKVINKKLKSTLVESRVGTILNDYVHESQRSLYGLNDSFVEWLRELPKSNSLYPCFFYKIIPNEQYTSAEVWHLNDKGDPDRKIADIITV